MIVGEREPVERLGDGLLRDLLESVAVHPEVVGEALELVGAELLKGVPLALGKLKINLNSLHVEDKYKSILLTLDVKSQMRLRDQNAFF